MSRFSQAEAEAAGWSIVHKRDEYEVVVGPGLVQKHPATIVAEKYHSPPGQKAVLIHEEAESMGLLLERIHAWEQHQSNVNEVEPVPVDNDAELKTFSLLEGDEAPEEGVGDPVQSVVVPAEPGDLTLEAETVTITDAEWSARSRADTLVTDEGQVVYAGGAGNVQDAEAARLLNKKAIEDRRAAEPAHGPVEQVEFDTAGLADTPGIGAGGTLVVREGESLDEVTARKEDLKKLRDEGRVASMNEQGQAIAPEGADKLAGLDVGIQERGDLGSEIPGQGAVARTLEEPDGESEEHPAPHLYPEGEPIVSEPPAEPASAVEADARADAEEEAAKEQRDESLAEAESDEANAAVREAGIEAAQEAHDEFAKDADEGESEPEAQAEPGEAVEDASPGNDEPAPAAVDAEPSEEGLDMPADEDVPEASSPVEDEPDSFTEKDDLDATDAAKAKAAELGIDLSQVEGTGKEGRVTAPDVEAAAEAATEPKAE